MNHFTRDQMTTRVARDIPEGAYVNLCIGLPARVTNYLPKDKETYLQSENGLLGMRPAPAPGEEDDDLIQSTSVAIGKSLDSPVSLAVAPMFIAPERSDRFV